MLLVFFWQVVFGIFFFNYSGQHLGWSNISNTFIVIALTYYHILCDIHYYIRSYCFEFFVSRIKIYEITKDVYIFPLLHQSTGADQITYAAVPCCKDDSLLSHLSVPRSDGFVSLLQGFNDVQYTHVQARQMKDTFIWYPGF